MPVVPSCDWVRICCSPVPQPLRASFPLLLEEKQHLRFAVQASNILVLLQTQVIATSIENAIKEADTYPLVPRNNRTHGAHLFLKHISPVWHGKKSPLALQGL